MRRLLALAVLLVTLPLGAQAANNPPPKPQDTRDTHVVSQQTQHKNEVKKQKVERKDDKQNQQIERKNDKQNHKIEPKKDNRR